MALNLQLSRTQLAEEKPKHKYNENENMSLTVSMLKKLSLK